MTSRCAQGAATMHEVVDQGLVKKYEVVKLEEREGVTLYENLSIPAVNEVIHYRD